MPADSTVGVGELSALNSIQNSSYRVGEVFRRPITPGVVVFSLGLGE